MTRALRLGLALTFIMSLAALGGCSGGKIPVSGLQPVDPPQSGPVSWFKGTRKAGFHGEIFDGLNWPVVDSLQPVLRWMPFPGVHHALGGKAWPFVAIDPALVSDVRYDIRLWEVQGLSPAALVHEADGIANTSFRTPDTLKPDTRYYWTVRARFMWRGRVRVSEWSLAQLCFACKPGVGDPRSVARREGFIPPESYYRFKTPAL